MCGPQQTTILRDGLPGFIFESNRGTKHSFTAETSLGAELAAGWTGKHSKKFKSKSEAVRLKVCVMGFLWSVYIALFGILCCSLFSALLQQRNTLRDFVN